MKTMLLSEGDLVVTHRDYAFVTGTGKVAQDLRGALLEPLGNDRFHPGWGSTLDQFLAQISDEQTRTDIEAEINRVILNYASVQRDKIEADIASDSESRYSTDEVLSRVEGVNVVANGDTMNVTIALRTVSGEVVVLTEAVV